MLSQISLYAPQLTLISLAMSILIPFLYLGSLAKYTNIRDRPRYTDFLFSSLALGVAAAIVAYLLARGIGATVDQRLLMLLHLAGPTLTLLFIHRLRDPRRVVPSQDASRNAQLPHQSSKPLTTIDTELKRKTVTKLPEGLVMGSTLRHEVETAAETLRNIRLHDLKSEGSEVIVEQIGILLEGPSGTGKQEVAKAIAASAQYSFLSIQLEPLLAHDGKEVERTLRTLFDSARNQQPAIVFIDHLERIGNLSPLSDSGRLLREHVLGIGKEFSSCSSLSIIATTDRARKIDATLRHALSLSKIIKVPLPNTTQRMKLFELFLSKFEPASDVNLIELAFRTQGLSGSDIKNICHHAVHFSMRREMTHPGAGEFMVEMKDLENALFTVTDQKSYGRDSMGSIVAFQV
jgi:hypothetical protein